MDIAQNKKKYFQKLTLIIRAMMFLLLSATNIVSAQKTNQPNILFIAVDDLKPNIGCFGDSLAITPNIDALGEKGLIFTNTHCQQAVCAPSRASLLTGRYPDQTEVWDLETLMRDKNPDILTLPQHFKENGYTTSGVGKIFDFRSVDSKNDEVSWTNYGNPYQNQLYNSTTGKPLYYYASPSAKDTIALLQAEAVTLGVNRKDYVQKHYWPAFENADVPFDAYVDGAIAKVGTNLLNQLNSADKPFFLGVGFQRPHLPFNAPKEFWDFYERDSFKIANFQNKSTNGPDIAYHNFGELRAYTDIPLTGNLSEDKQLELIHAYYAAISYIDFLVGMLTQRLEELGLAENTIIVLWGDHGWHLGDHNLWCKHSNFEQATRSPLIISYPGQPNAGKKYTHPAEFTDIATTLCKISGLDVPLDFEGESLIPAFENPEINIREGALSQYPRSQSGTKYMGYSLRTERYRYTKWVNRISKEHFTAELYDYDIDPEETINLVNNSEYTNLVAKLDSIIQERIYIPSTQEKVSFKIRTINSFGDTINKNNVKIQFSDGENNTNIHGETFFTQIPGVYTYSINVKGFKEISSQIDHKKDTIIELLLEPEEFDIHLKVKAKWNNSELSKVNVQIGEQNLISNNDGDVIFKQIPYGFYSIQIKLKNGWTQMFDNIELYSDTSITLFVAEPTYNIVVNVLNKYSNKSIYQSSVKLNEYEIFTNSFGVSIFTTPIGRYKLNINHYKYIEVSDSVDIIGDTTFYFLLTPGFSDIKFKLNENTTPVNSASILINDTALVSNNIGISNFKNLPAFTLYNYTIKKDAYKTVEGNLFLINDTTLNIQMQNLETSFSNNKLEEVTFWPNPVQSSLYINNHSQWKIRVKVQNITGKQITSFVMPKNNLYEWNTNSINPGMYIITFYSKGKTKISKLIKQ